MALRILLMLAALLAATQTAMSQSSKQGVLRARPGQPEAASPAQPGIYKLEESGRRPGGVHYVPAGYRPGQPAPLLLLLHGAGGTGEGTLPAFLEEADRTGTLVLAPNSQGPTWDVIGGGYGPDVATIDAALGRVFATFPIDPARLAVGGFSDGASYALSLGLANGDLFSHVMAFSPGFMAPSRQEGKPRIFITHGTRDEVLPIESCSRRLVPRLRQAGYDLAYREFEGGHVIRPEMMDFAFRWFQGGPGLNKFKTPELARAPITK